MTFPTCPCIWPPGALRLLPSYFQSHSRFQTLYGTIKKKRNTGKSHQQKDRPHKIQTESASKAIPVAQYAGTLFVLYELVDQE